MTEGFWPGGKASIVLLPSGEQGASLISLAGEWTRMGLLGPALWVLPERVADGAGGPPRIVAVVLGLGADLELVEVEVDLFEALARQSLGLVRLVKLRSATPSRDIDAEQDAIAERVGEYVRKSMPMPSPGATVVDQSSALSNIALICAPSEFQLKQRVDWASSEYGLVVIASPEDRSSPWAGDAFVRDDERFVGFTLLHLASVAGLWNGVPTGSFEMAHREESGHRSVWITRTFVNAVLTEAIGRRTAAQVLSEAARPDSLLVDPSLSQPPVGTFFIQDPQVGGYIDEMVSASMNLDDRALAFKAVQEQTDPAKRRVGFWRQLGDFFSFSADKLVRMPYWAWRSVSSRTYRQTTRVLHSEDGASVVGMDLSEVFDVRERELLAAGERMHDVEARARAEADAPSATSHVRTTPRLWERLREFVFGTLDGSADLSDLGFDPIDDRVPIFGRVSDVLALPGAPWVAPRENVPDDFPARVDWYALALEYPRERLGDAQEAARKRLKEAEPELAAATAAAEREATADPRPTAAEDAETGGTVEDAPKRKRTARSKAEKRLAEATAVYEAAAHDVERFTRGASLFDAWAAPQERSFVWRLLVRLAHERVTAVRGAEGIARAIDDVTLVEPGELITLRRRFHRTMLVVWGISAVLAVVAGVLLFTVDGSTIDPATVFALFWMVLAALATIAILVTVSALIAYHRGWSRFEQQVVQQQRRVTALARSARHARQEGARLESLHRQTVDWLVLLATAIHRPWSVPEEWTRRDEHAVAKGAMPFALRLAAVQDGDHSTNAYLQSIAAEHLFVKGWRYQAFERLVQDVAEERGALSTAFGLRSLDEDLPHAPNHTRQMLLAALKDEKVLTRVAGPMLESLVASVHRDEAGSSRGRVQPLAQDPLAVLVRGANRSTGTADLPWDEFLLGSLGDRRNPMTPLSSTVLTDIEVGERHHERVQSYVVLPARLTSQFTYSADAPVEVIPISDTGAAIDLAWRVDIAGPVPIGAIHLWSSAAQSAREPEQQVNPIVEESGI